MKLFSSFGGTFIHCLRGIFTSVLFLEFVLITFGGSFQQCASEIVNHSQSDRTVLYIIQVSNHVQVDRSKSGAAVTLQKLW